MTWIYEDTNGLLESIVLRLPSLLRQHQTLLAQIIFPHTVPELS